MISLGCNVKEKVSRCITYTNICKCDARLQRQPVRSRESSLDPGLPDGSRTKGRARWGDPGGSEGRGGQERSSSSSSGVSSGVGVSPGFNRHPPPSHLCLELVCSSPGAWNTNQLSTFELLLVEKEANNTKKPIPCPAGGARSFIPLQGGQRGGRWGGRWGLGGPVSSGMQPPHPAEPLSHTCLWDSVPRCCGSSRSVHR